MFLSQLDPLLGISLGCSIGCAAIHIQLPTGFLPAVEAGVLQKLQPLIHRHVAELTANQPDLVVRSFAEPMRRCLLEAHSDPTSPLQMQDDDSQRGSKSDYTRDFFNRKRRRQKTQPEVPRRDECTEGV